MHVIAAKAVAFGEALTEDFKAYQQQVVLNAKTLADALTEKGLRIVSGGTDNHVMSIDVTSFNITGKVAERALDDVGITTNKNTIPFDKESPFVTSGIRIGTPAVTTRGFNEEDMKEIASIIADVLAHPEDEAVKRDAKARVRAITEKYPLYQ